MPPVKGQILLLLSLLLSSCEKDSRHWLVVFLANADLEDVSCPPPSHPMILSGVFWMCDKGAYEQRVTFGNDHPTDKILEFLTPNGISIRSVLGAQRKMAALGSNSPLYVFAPSLNWGFIAVAPPSRYLRGGASLEWFDFMEYKKRPLQFDYEVWVVLLPEKLSPIEKDLWLSRWDSHLRRWLESQRDAEHLYVAVVTLNQSRKIESALVFMPERQKKHSSQQDLQTASNLSLHFHSSLLTLTESHSFLEVHSLQSDIETAQLRTNLITLPASREDVELMTQKLEMLKNEKAMSRLQRISEVVHLFQIYKTGLTELPLPYDSANYWNAMTEAFINPPKEQNK